MPVSNSKYSIFNTKKLVPTARPTYSTPAPAAITCATAGSDSALTALQNSLAKETAKKKDNT